MPSIETGLLKLGEGKAVKPAVFLVRLTFQSREFRDRMREALDMEKRQPSAAADQLRELATWLERHVVASLSNQAARGYLVRWAHRLEDRLAHREIRRAVESGDLCSTAPEPPKVGGYPLGIRNPGAVVCRGGYVPD